MSSADPRVEADRWLRAAEDDVVWGRHDASGGFPAPACLHAQQAAEKAVKAVHYHRGARAVLGHSVKRLVDALEPREPALDALLKDAADLDLLYVPTRDPNGLDHGGTPGESFVPAQAEVALEAASRIVDAVRVILGTGPTSRRTPG